MATTTTNYGFDVPTSSDLVKNGATQIALLGQDLDTFLFRPFTKNGVINGAFDIWQRGTSVAANNGYAADRWRCYSNAVDLTVSRQVTGDTTNLPNIQYCARVQRNSGATGTGTKFLTQPFETSNSIPFAGKQVTFSFYARKGANFSATSDALAIRVFTGTGTDQNYIDGYTGVATAVSGSATLTTTWQRFTATGTIAATATELSVVLSYDPTGTAGANDYFEATGIQLELGNQATPFTRASSTGLAGELAACQRYFERQDSTLGSTFTPFGMGACSSTTQAYNNIYYTSKRTNPSLSFTAANTFAVTSASYAAVACTAISSAASGLTGAITLATVASGLVAGNATQLYRNSSATAYIDISAEL